MHILYGQISLARSGIQPLENKLARSGQIDQAEILRRRTHENQIIVLGVVQRKQRTTLDSKRTVEQVEDMVQLVDRENFSYTRVVIKDECAGIGARD